MASTRKRAAGALAAVYALKDNPAVQRLLQDEKAREELRVALESGRKAYGRASNGKAPADLLNDRKFQREFKRSSEALRDASARLQKGPKRRGRRGLGGLLLLTVVGGAVALVVNEGVRNKVLDLLFGAEEEFDYTSSTTAPASPPPATSATTSSSSTTGSIGTASSTETTPPAAAVDQEPEIS
jgi:hypothetical protein